MNLGAALLGVGRDSAPAVIEGDTVLTYGELRRTAAAVAGGLAGTTPLGSVVAIEITGRSEFVVAYLAVLLAGRIAAPLNPDAPPAELARERRMVGAIHTLDVDAVHALAAPGPAAALAAPIPVDPSAPAALLCTSGTAGAPRAAILTHANLLANLEQVQSVPRLAARADDVVLGVLPLFHVFGLNVVVGLALHAGAAIVLAERFDPAATLELVRTHGVTVLVGVPSMFAAWAASPGGAPDACRGVRLAVSGAAPLDRATADAFRARFAIEVDEGYGLTEASPIVATTAVDRAIRPGSIGPPLPGVEVRLVDVDGSDALVGDPGEIWVRGPNVFAGYWNDAEATARVLDDQGWLHTGDVAVADDDGWLTLVDRIKDLIIVSGFNVYPAEVEDALHEHPGVADVGVAGEHDDRRGEHVVAYVVARDPAAPPSGDELAAHLRTRLARYKIPARFELVSSLPRNVAGKLVRRELDASRARDGDDATANPA